MRIVIGADHAGFTLKEDLAAHIRALVHQLVDVGTHGTEAVDYPDYAEAGGFGLVIGVDRKGNADGLKTNGARMVVRDLAELLSWDFGQPLEPVQ
jgi:hypothetical protein